MLLYRILGFEGYRKVAVNNSYWQSKNNRHVRLNNSLAMQINMLHIMNPVDASDYIDRMHCLHSLNQLSKGDGNRAICNCNGHIVEWFQQHALYYLHLFGYQKHRTAFIFEFIT